MRARSTANPEPTGSDTDTNTIGIVDVALCASTTAFVGEANIRSTLRSTSSSGHRSQPLVVAFSHSLYDDVMPSLHVAQMEHFEVKTLKSGLYVRAEVRIEDPDDLGLCRGEGGCRDAPRQRQGLDQCSTGDDGRLCAILIL